MGCGSGKHLRTAELLHCPICFNLFKVPRMLPCQHTFCEDCLNRYITGTVSENPLDAEGRTFLCPVCREPTTSPLSEKPREKWAKGFPKNRLIITLFDGEPQRSECCRLHPSKLIDIFCETHVEMGCSTCLMTRHKACDILPLEAYVKGGKFRRSCQKNTDLLLQYRRLFEDAMVEMSREMDKLEGQKTDIIEDIRRTRETINGMLDELQNKLEGSVEEKYKSECDHLEDQVNHCRRNITILNTTIEQMATAQTDIQMVQKAEIIVTVEEKLSKFGGQFREDHGNFKLVDLSVEYDSLLKDLMSGLEHFGKVNVEKTNNKLPMPSFVPKSLITEPPEVKRHRNKHVVKVGEFSVTGKKESFFCNITSSVVLTDGRVILADDSNCKLKMLSGRFKMKGELKLETNPLHLARVSDEEVAVTLPGQRQVQFITVGSDSLFQGRLIPTRLDCWGIDVLDGVVVVTTGRDGHSIIFLEMSGKEINSYLLTTNADENIRCPVAVTSDKKTKLLYITCTGGAWSKGCVIEMNLTGKVLRSFLDPDIDTPRACALDRHGKLYIAGLESSTLYQMTLGGDVYKIFPAKTEQVTGPLHVNFIRNYHIRFLLTEVASDILKVYELPTQTYTIKSSS